MSLQDYDGPAQRYGEAVSASTTPLSIAIVSDNKLMHRPVICKDFIQDAFYSELMKEPVSMYGFTWEPGRLSMKLSTYQFALQFLRPDLYEKAPRVLELVNAWDTALGYPKSTLAKDKSKDGRFLLTVSREWTTQPLRISALLLFARVGTAYEGQPLPDFISGDNSKKCLNPYDWTYVKGCEKVFLNLYENREWPKQTYEMFKNHARSGIHHGSGIYAFTTGRPTG